MAMDPTKALNITACLFRGNSIEVAGSESMGGSVVAFGGVVTIEDTVFMENRAFFGAGLLVQQANLTITNTRFVNNTAYRYGGGIVQLDAGFMDIQNSNFDSNSAVIGGGAIGITAASRPARYILKNCEFFSNVAGDDGGGAVFLLFVDRNQDDQDGQAGILTFISPTFFANRAASNGWIMSILCGNVYVESDFASEYKEDESAFVVQKGYEYCSSLTFLTSLEVVEPGPELSSARFSDTGTYVVLTFAQDTDYGGVAGLGGSFDCPLLLDYPGASDADDCSWTSARSIKVTLHYGASVAPLDSITALANMVALSRSSDVLNVKSSVTILPPEKNPEPQLVPEVWYTALAHCEDLVLDVSASTGAGGRAMKSYLWELYDWTVEQESDAPSTANELAYVEAASASGGSSKLTIPGEGRPSKQELTWYFNITATNWLGGVGWKSVEVRVSAETEDPPLLSLVGGSTRTVLRAASLSIAANAKVTTCLTDKTSRLTYEWSELRTGGAFTSTSANPSMFKLPSHTLEVGVEYEFRVDVTDSVGYSSFATQVVTVESSPLIAAVAGGNSTVSGGTDLALDLTPTVDPDEEDGVCQDCLYSVSCTGTLSGSGCDLTLPVGETSGGVFMVQSQELVSGETYMFQVSIRRSTESAWSTTLTSFSVGGEAPLPTLSIAPLSVEKVNADSVVAIEAEITLSEESVATAEWTLKGGVLNGFDELKLAAYSSLEHMYSGPGVLSANMVLAANSLVAGSTYTFSLSATYVSDGRRRLQLEDDGDDGATDISSASASIYLSVNSPPTGGLFQVSPTEGVAMKDAFDFTTYAWEDDVADLPLTYVFAYVSGSADETDTSSEMIVRAALESSEATDVYLPQGYGSNSTLFASMYALDALGAFSRANFGVTVSAYDGGVEDLYKRVNDLVTEALAAGNTDSVMQVLDVASSSLNAANCTAAPDCEAFNRDDCGTDGLREDNTCGKCFPGSVGVMGVHNSLCVDTATLDASCSDDEKNGSETDVDCGGSTCTPCPSGSTCLVNTDCSYNNCPEPTSTTADQLCVSPPKGCPNGCGGTSRGSCVYASSTSGAELTAAECPADAPISTCRASCVCFDGYGGDGCQYSDVELEAAVELREQALLYIQESASNVDISRDTISRQAALLSKLSVIPQEMKASSVTLVLDLGAETARLADDSGEGVASTAASAIVEIIGQVTLASSYLGEDSDMGGLSNVVGSLIAAQVSEKVVGESAEEISSDYFRLSTGVYDTSTLGTIQISPPLTDEDNAVGRSAPSIGLSTELGEAFSGVSSISLAVAEWVIDPRQTDKTTSSDGTNAVVSTVVRFYADPIDPASFSSSVRRRLKERKRSTVGDISVQSEKGRWQDRARRRSLLQDLGSIEITIPNTVSQAWDPQHIETFTHVCDWDSMETQSSTCPNGTEIITVCTGTALTREVECSNNGTEPECASWQGSDESFGSATADNCEVSSFDELWTTCLCSYAAAMGDLPDGTGSNQVDFASTFLNTPGEFISIWSEATTLTWTEVQSATPVFSTMGGILALAVISAGFGWRLDQQDRGHPASFRAWLASIACFLCCCGCYRTEESHVGSDPLRQTTFQKEATNREKLSTPHKTKQVMTRDEKLKLLAAAVQRASKNDIESTAPHHLAERRVKQNMKLLIMVHHDVVSVFYCFYEWFSRPQRVALLLCTVVTLMATEATVFSTIMFKDDGTCGSLDNLTDCTASDTANVNVGGVGSSCEWDEGSRTCYLPEPEEDMETSLVISTISLILALPLELVVVAIFAAFLTRPTKTKGDRAEAENKPAERTEKISVSKGGKDGVATTSGKSGDPDDVDANDDLESRLSTELALARDAQHQRDGKVQRMWRILRCWCGFCGCEARREARLVKEVKTSIRSAIRLEEEMAKADDLHVKEALLFERAEADSLNYIERQVFFKSRILNYGEEDRLSGVPSCVKYLAWLFIVGYAVGLSFYVCLFAVKAGRATSVQWMISFWVAFVEDVLILIPLKLAFVYLFLPSLMRHRMRSDMFTRIPRHASSVQVARRNPDLQVSALILQGSIPAGSEFEKFIPLFNTRSRWYTCVAGLVFTILAFLMLLPDVLQAMVLDTLIAVMVGGGVFVLVKLVPVSFWGFIGFLAAAAVIMFFLWTNHKRTMKKEKKLRRARATQDCCAHRIRTFCDMNATPLQHTPSPGKTIFASTKAADRGQQSPRTDILARWMSTVKPGFVQPPQVAQSGMPPRNFYIQGGTMHSVAPGRLISEAESRCESRGRCDSCAASSWGEVYISDGESSQHDDVGNNDDESSAARGSRLHDRGQSRSSCSISRSESDGPASAFDLERSIQLGTTACTTFFTGLEDPLHRVGDVTGFLRGNGYEDDDGKAEPERFPGTMTEAGSGWLLSQSPVRQSRRRVDTAPGVDGEAMSR